MTDLHQKMSIAFKLEYMAIGWRVSADPNVSILVDIDSVLRLGPIKSFARPAPRVQQVSLLVKLENRRSSEGALRTGRSKRGANFIEGVGRGPLQNPDVVVAINGQAADLPDDPVVWQFLRPEWIDTIRGRILCERSKSIGGEQNCRGNSHAHRESCPVVAQRESVHETLRAINLRLAGGGAQYRTAGGGGQRGGFEMCRLHRRGLGVPLLLRV